MTIQKQLTALITSLCIVATTGSMSVLAFTPANGSAGKVTLDSGMAIYDSDGDIIISNSDLSTADGALVLEDITPGQSIYIPIGDDSLDASTNGTTLVETGSVSPAYASPEDLADDDLFKMTIDKDGTGKSLISSVEVLANYRLDTFTRGSYIRITLKDSSTIDELKAVVDLTFKARKSSATTAGHSSTSAWDAGDYANFKITLWVNNEKVTGSDGSADTGASVYFDPEANDSNTFVWGDDRAALQFDTDDAGTSFYAKLSTKINSEIYTTYGDPVNAELYFYDFVGNPSIPSTSRATLTLGIPWDEDDSYAPDPESCYIYQLTSDGALVDITSSFIYSDGDYEIPGWSTKTRTLGTYVVSDTDLEVEDNSYYADDDESLDWDDDDADPDAGSTDSGEKTLPNTGSENLVDLALAGVAVSLTAASAILLRKPVQK